MFPGTDPDWYEKFWLTEMPEPKRRRPVRHLTRLAVLVALLAGGGAVLTEFHASHNDSGYQSWEQE